MHFFIKYHDFLLQNINILAFVLQVNSKPSATHSNNHSQPSSGSTVPVPGNDTGWASFPSPTKATVNTDEPQAQSPTSNHRAATQPKG